MTHISFYFLFWETALCVVINRPGWRRSLLVWFEGFFPGKVEGGEHHNFQFLLSSPSTYLPRFDGGKSFNHLTSLFNVLRITTNCRILLLDV